jgi:hypothetical protein
MAIRALFNLAAALLPDPARRKRLRCIGNLDDTALILRYGWRKLRYRRVVRDYQRYRSTRRARLVVYSCITNRYDTPMRLHAINPDYDYVLFTDEPGLFDPRDHLWEFRPLPSLGQDSSRLSRYPKFNPQELLPEYEESLYIDANIDLVTDLVYRDVERERALGSPIAIGVHPKRACIYEEFERLRQGRVDSDEILAAQRAMIEAAGYPAGNGLFENNVIYRRHRDPAVVEFGRRCWEMIVAGSRRDQLAVVFCAWQLGLPLRPLNPRAYRRIKDEVLIFPHRKGGNG